MTSSRTDLVSIAVDIPEIYSDLMIHTSRIFERMRCVIPIAFSVFNAFEDFGVTCRRYFKVNVRTTHELSSRGQL
jgi:hypothetical protein